MNISNDEIGEDDNRIVGDSQDIILAFQLSFFAMRELSALPWGTLEKKLQDDESSDIILDILKKTCLHSICRKTPPSVKYRRLFLSELIKRHEASSTEPLDELYDAFGDVVGVEEEPLCYKSYLLLTGDAISLSESTALVSEGTTGLVTWDAALYLTEWALENPQVFKDRNVLELGSGVGLTGVAVCLSCAPGRYVFSDCHHSVLRLLRNNLRLNGLPIGSEPLSSVSVEELDWAAVSEDWLREFHFDTVIASDVAYDPDIIPCLVGLLYKILNSTLKDSHTDIYVSSTIRNPDTHLCFKSQLESSGIKSEVISGPVKPVFPYNRNTSTEIIKLYL
ncbi:hypothetical protein GJAV_G00216280 [Gymnothorax javanicus]|nr:hypothetical protein GJAV_G00216280 [Gymnothorax javanicus]